MTTSEAPNRIRELREAEGVSLKSLASDIDVDYTVLSRWERGDRQLPVVVVGKLCTRFGVSADYLLCLTPNGKEAA